MSFSPSSRGRLTDRDLDRFPGGTLFDRVARAVCHAGCLPRKELYEAWEVARRARRLFRGGRVVDLGAGHGLLAQLMLILDDSSPSAIAVDKAIPASAARLQAALVSAWPRLAGRVSFVEGALESVEILADDVVVSSHACGALTDVVLDRAAAARARVVGPAVLSRPRRQRRRRAGGLGGCGAGDRHPPGPAAGSARLPRLDAGDSRRDHAQEPPAPGRPGGILKTFECNNRMT